MNYILPILLGTLCISFNSNTCFQSLLKKIQLKRETAYQPITIQNNSNTPICITYKKKNDSEIISLEIAPGNTLYLPYPWNTYARSKEVNTLGLMAFYHGKTIGHSTVIIANNEPVPFIKIEAPFLITVS